MAMLAMATLGTACQGDPDALGLRDPDQVSKVSREKIVIPNPAGARRRVGGGKLRDRRPVSAEDQGWEEKLDLARGYASAGYDAQALQVLDACLSRHPKEPWSGQMRALKTSVQMRRTEERLLRVEAHGVRDYVSFSTPVDFKIRIQNVSNEKIILRAPGANVSTISPSALSVKITRIDRDIYASQVQRSWTQNVFLHRPGGGALTIEPGRSHELSIRIPPAEVGAPIAGLRILEVGGMLRPTRMSYGKEGRTVRLRIRKGRVVVLPENYEPIVLDPLRSMRTAVDTGAAQHLLIASEFVPRRRRAEAVSILARAISEGDVTLRRASLGALAILREHAAGAPLRPLVEPLVDVLLSSPMRAEAIMEGITALSDVRLAPDLRLWRDWWNRDLREDARVPPPGGQLVTSLEDAPAAE